MRLSLVLILLSLALVSFVEAYGGRQVAADTEKDLKPGEGREIVEEHCLVCHDATLIVAPELTRSQWDRVIGEMIEEQGMEEPTPEIRQVILDYLVRTQGSPP